MEAVDIVGLLVPLTYLVMLAVEKWRPARQFPPRLTSGRRRALAGEQQTTTSDSGCARANSA